VLGYLLWLSALPGAQIHAVCTRLRLPVTLRAALLAAHDLRADLPGLVSARPSAVTARLEDVPLMSIFAAWLAAPPDQRPALENYLLRWRHIKPTVTGHTLKERGLEPGPRYQKILRRLREAWLDGEVTSKAEESALLDELTGAQSQGA
jgi:tRNA nucleotidyltransferase/poly(A) polymerase